MNEYDPVKEAQAILAGVPREGSAAEGLREVAILSRLDPDGLNGRCPDDMDPVEWAAFLEVCKRSEAEEAAGVVYPPTEDGWIP